MPDSPINYDPARRAETAEERLRHVLDDMSAIEGLPREPEVRPGVVPASMASAIALQRSPASLGNASQDGSGDRPRRPFAARESDGKEEAVVEEGTPEWWAEQVEEVVGRDEEAGEHLVVIASREAHSRRRAYEAAGEYREAWEQWGTSLVDAWADKARFREAEERLRRAVAGLAPAEGE